MNNTKPQPIELKNGLVFNPTPWNNNTTIKIEPIDYETSLQPDIEIKQEDDNVIFETEKVIIKEELNLDEIYEESTTYDPLELTSTPNLETCSICGNNYRRNTQDLNNHLQIIHRVLTISGNGGWCHKCKNWYPETKYLKHNPCFAHMRQTTNCDICKKKFQTTKLLDAHKFCTHRPLIYHESIDPCEDLIVKKIFCDICNASFPAKTQLNNHLTLMHRPYTLNGVGAYCTRCFQWFSEDLFNNHRPCTKKTPVMCYICGANFKFPKLLKIHKYIIHRPLTIQFISDAFCDKCNRWFKEDNYLMHKCIRHCNTSHLYLCNICDRNYLNDSDMKKHLYNFHRPIAALQSNEIFCDFCKNYFDETVFEGHIPCHSVDSKCVFCLIVMPSKDHYLQHDLSWIRWRSYQCNLCDLNTQDMILADLNQHMINCHERKGVFGCVKCKFDFISTETVEEHVNCCHMGCRCVMEPCICLKYTYEYYYEFVKQRNLLGEFKRDN